MLELLYGYKVVAISPWDIKPVCYLSLEEVGWEMSHLTMKYKLFPLVHLAQFTSLDFPGLVVVVEVVPQ